MNTKILYVVTSSEDDNYLEQTFLSIYSLRQHNPEAHVILLTDDQTDATIKGTRAKLLEYVSEKCVVTLDKSLTKMRRSRILKTTMREYVTGRFLFIDSDTIICSNLSLIDKTEINNIGAVLDAHRILSHHYGKEKLLRQSETLSFCMENEEFFFNSGVMLVNDNALTHEFFKRWNKNWIDSTEKGINQDQPALLKTNIQEGHLITELEGLWNCQLMYGFNYYRTAKIIHYFASRYSTNNGGYIYEFMNPHILEKIKISGEINSIIHKKLFHPLSCFDDRLELIGGIDVDILNTHVYKLIRLIYNRKPKFFNIIQNILYLLNKRNKNKKE